MSVPRFQKINFGTYDNYIPVSELSKKSWNQQHFALRFPKPPRPGKKRRSKPSQLRDNAVPIHDSEKIKEVSKRPLWMHSSLMRISERPSDYLAARRQRPYKPTHQPKEDTKVADIEKPVYPETPKKGKEDKQEGTKDVSESETEPTALKEPKVTKKESKKDKDIETGTRDEKDVAKTDAKKERKASKEGKESGTESEDEKKDVKKEKKASKEDKESGTESEDEKKDVKKEKKVSKKDKESGTESEDEKKDAKKEKKVS
ncbi:unnamed protein product, partial [Gulo gulo]